MSIALEMATLQVQQIASPFQSRSLVPDTFAPQTPGDINRDTVTAPYGMPTDIPLPLDPSGGSFVPATGTDVADLPDYDPWLSIQIEKNYDDSRPVASTYGEPIQAKAHSLVAEWGGMPYPVRDYQDWSYSVLQVYRQQSMHNSSGPSGLYYGPQMTAWEFGAMTPQTDYWSTVILGAGQ
jgi:hypothetical protein